MVNLLALALIQGSAWAYGALILPRFWFDRRSERLAVSLAIGLAVLSYAIFALGHLGFLYRQWILVLLLAPLLVQGVRLARKVWQRQISFPGIKRPWDGNASDRWLPYITLGVVLFLTGFDLTEALHLDLCPDRYHVIFAVSFLNNHRIEFLPGAVISCYPMFVEMLFVIGVMFEPESMSSMIHVSFLPLSALALYAALGRRWRRTGAAFGALWILAQMMLHKFAPMGFDDLGATFYASVALIPLLKFIEKPNWRDAFLSGAFAGLAAACRLNAALLTAFPLALGLIVMIFTHRGASFRKACLGVLLFGLAALALYSPWMIRNAIQSGSPFAPVLTEFFPLHPDFDYALAGYQREYPIRADLFFQYPFRAVAVYYDHIVREGSSAVFLLPVSLLILAIHAIMQRSRESAFIALIAFLAFLAYVLAGPTRPRYAFPALPFFCAAAAAATSLLVDQLRPRLRILVAILFSIISITIIFEGIRDYRGVLLHRPLLSERSRQVYLTLAYPYYSRMLEINRLLGPGDRLAVHRADCRYNHLTIPFSPVTYWGRGHAEFLLWKARQEDPQHTPERFRELLNQAGITYLYVGEAYDIFPKSVLQEVKRWPDAVLYRV